MRVAVCVVIKLENHYLKEYVDHYYNLGFDNIILYDNNDLNGEQPDEVIHDYIKNGFVIVENVRGKKDTQLVSYNECYKKYSHLYDWIAFLDADEFLDLKKTSNIKDFLSKSIFEKFNCIKINWLNFDDNNLLKVENNNYSIKRFTHPIRLENYFTKIFLRANIPNCSINSSHGALLTNVADHRFNEGNAASVVSCDDAGNPCRNVRNQYPKKNSVRLNHYRFRTIEEYIQIKIARGYPNRFGNYGLDFLTVSSFFIYNKLSYKKYKLAKDIFKKNNHKAPSYFYVMCKYLSSRIDFSFRALFCRLNCFFYSLHHKA